ncbi:DNA-3-methyladenine glycosylase I [Dichotomicrobium thermohalophilum]|uniref:DNA-3-methyladenine glycosylase I n=1 Tax=Dichotomicrobium thermohalophilum TaxID=933063 RepID=A0A397PNQ6_9HYPH|nr:DNA-3-methyladenine glycosylase I [Dichotomicrobium thermohalophilum]RIA47371.1 DNA-3-methyladenine glycosylase I [Dichotomicrobium thermohalophilum]
MSAPRTVECAWTTSDPLYIAYHDEEWGVPKTDDAALFEKLCLEVFQAGLSWLTVLRKREAFNAAFDGFDAETVACYGPEKIDALMAEPGIIRNRRKIEAVINNAGAYLRLRETATLADFLWDFVDGEAIQNRFTDPANVPAVTPLSERLSRALRERGFRFTGPTLAYAYMQSIGMVNDHLVTCPRHDACARLAKVF